MSTDRFRLETKIDTYDCDMSGRVSPGGLMRIFNSSAEQNMERDGQSYDDLKDIGQVMMITRLDMIFLDPPAHGDSAEIVTWPCEPDAASIKRCYSVEKDGRQLVKASSVWVIVDPESRRILRMSETDVTGNYFEEDECFPGTRLKISRAQAEAMETAGTHRVTLRDCDYNGHLNNTIYLDILCDHVPELYEYGKHRVKALRLHFVNEAPLGSELTVKRIKEGNTYIFRTLLEDGTVNVECSMEIS